MNATSRFRLVSFVSTLVIVPVVTYIVILFAKGYRPDFQTQKLEPTGILAATSQPEGAQTIINGEIKTATNNSLNLNPGDYEVQIKKVGFHPWSKQLKIEKEIVTRANAFLFANVPILKAITSSGVINPQIAPDKSQVIFLSGTGLYRLDITDSPLGIINREPQLITNLKTNRLNFFEARWSPDSRQLLLQSSASAQLVDVNSGKITESSIGLPALFLEWDKKQFESYHRQLNSLPVNVRDLLSTISGQLVWSNNDKKILYTATASATLPDQLLPPLPGSSTQIQTRQIQPGFVYVYDLEEDRNFIIGNVSENWTWFPTSNHLYKIDGNNIVIKEYDNSNLITYFAGILIDNFAVPYPSGKQFLVLINPNPELSKTANLYSLNLK